MDAATIDSQRRQRIEGDRALLVMSLTHAIRHATDMLMVSTDEAEAMGLRATVAVLTATLERWTR